MKKKQSKSWISISNISPNDTSVYMLLGKMHFDKKEYEETVDDMNKIIARDQNQREPYLLSFPVEHGTWSGRAGR